MLNQYSASFGGALAFGRVHFFFGHLHAVGVGQVFHRLDEIHARVLHQEANGIAILATTEAMEELLGGTDREGGRFLSVEGAQAHEVGATLLELDVLAHHLDHVDTVEQFLQE